MPSRCQASGARFVMPASMSKDPPTPCRTGTSSDEPYVPRKISFLGEIMPRNSMSAPELPDVGRNLGAVVRVEIAVVAAGDPQAGKALLQAAPQASPAPRAARRADRSSGPRGAPEPAAARTDRCRRPVPARAAAAACSPRRSTGRRPAAGRNPSREFAQQRIVAQVDDLGRIEHAKQNPAARDKRRAAALDHVVHAQRHRDRRRTAAACRLRIGSPPECTAVSACLACREGARRTPPDSQA